MNYDLYTELENKLKNCKKETIYEMYLFLHSFAVKPGQISIRRNLNSIGQDLFVEVENNRDGGFASIRLYQGRLSTIDLCRRNDEYTNYLEVVGNNATLRLFNDNGCYIIEMHYDQETKTVSKNISFYDKDALEYVLSSTNNTRAVTKSLFDYDGIKPDYILEYENEESENFYNDVRYNYEIIFELIKVADAKNAKLKLNE